MGIPCHPRAPYFRRTSPESTGGRCLGVPHIRRSSAKQPPCLVAHTNKLIGPNACPSWACLAPLELLGQLGIRTHQRGPTAFPDLVDGGCSLREWRLQMFLCTFASCFDLTTHPSSSRSAEAAAIVQDTRQEKTSPVRMLTFSITRSRATRSADQNVAARAYFDGASSTEASAACRSHAVHVHGRS